MVQEQLQNSSDMTDQIENHDHQCGWIKFSESKLISLEKRILQVVQNAYKGWHVLIDHKPDVEAKIWTISLNGDADNTPLVMLHGFGAGVGFWCLNLDKLSHNRPVYAIDLLGFGRSSRPDFHRDPIEAENEMIDSIEKWRKAVQLEKFVLLGHSMGGYLATSYAIKYPDRVKHLILADPWGFGEKSASSPRQRPNGRPIPLWMKALILVMYPLTVFNPLATVRAAGPWGPWLVKKMRSDISNKYAGRLDDHEIISDYIYHCNAQKPTGETAFHSMVTGFAYAKNPMIRRVDKLDPKVPITIFNGEDTWMDKTIGPQLQELRSDSYVRWEVIDGGHHVHADNPEGFNNIVVEACKIADSNKDTAQMNQLNLKDETETDNFEHLQLSETQVTALTTA